MDFNQFMKGEPLVRKLAALSKYVVLPGAMVAALVYSYPDYARSSKKQTPAASNAASDAASDAASE